MLFTQFLVRFIQSFVCALLKFSMAVTEFEILINTLYLKIIPCEIAKQKSMLFRF